MNLSNYEAQAPFQQKHLLTLQDWSEDEIYQCLSLAVRLKAMQKSGEEQHCLTGKTLAMIFAKSSTQEFCCSLCCVCFVYRFSTFQHNQFSLIQML